MICSIRIPDVLQARIDKAAGDDGRTKWILEACRMRLDSSGDGESIRSTQVSSDKLHAISSDMQVSNPAPPTKPSMQALRDICAGVVVPAGVAALGLSTEPLITVASEIPICGKNWWEDGEHFECLMDAGHREALANKHGLRGMVRRLDD